MPTAPIRVLLIEDHGLVRAGIRLVLEREPDIAVLGEAGDGAGGLQLFQRLAAEGGLDVVVTDLGLPDIGGLEVARRVKARHPAVCPHLAPEDVLVDSMRGRSSTWTRIRINLQHVPEAERPAQEELEVDYDPWAAGGR